MTVPPATPGDEHPDDLLSAHVDGELDDAARQRVEAHLDGCERCRASATGLRETREMVRALPAVDPGPLVEGLLTRHHRILRTGAGFVGATAVALLALALTAAVEHPRVVPPVEELAAAHEEAAHDGLDGMEAVDDAGRRYAAPAGLIGSSVRLSRHDIYDGRDLTVVVYRGDGAAVSVYQQPGDLEWDSLPDGELHLVGERRMWMRPEVPVVLVGEVGDLVVTVVSEDRSAALTAFAGFPERHRSSRWDRLHDACQRVTELFALRGG